MKAISALLFAALLCVPASASPHLRAPAKGQINVAVVMTDGATMIDFAGPWEVFQDVHVPGRGDSMEDMMPFRLYTVGQSRDAVRASAGMQIVPDYTFDDAPAPNIIVVGAQRGSKDLEAWLGKVAPKADVVMSVCTGAFKLARAGLFEGKKATTHHNFFDAFEEQFPDVQLVRGRRFVEADDHVFSAGGLTSGIDLALHVVALYFGTDVAATTAEYMEYESNGWRTGKASSTKGK